MKTVGAYDAKTHFSQLLDEVSEGATIIITKHGMPVARLVPMAERRNAAEAIERWLEKRKNIRLGPDLTIREMIEDGRRF